MTRFPIRTVKQKSTNEIVSNCSQMKNISYCSCYKCEHCSWYLWLTPIWIRVTGLETVLAFVPKCIHPFEELATKHRADSWMVVRFFKIKSGLKNCISGEVAGKHLIDNERVRVAGKYICLRQAAWRHDL